MEEEASQHSTVHKEQNESKAIPSEYIELDLNKIKEFMYILYITLFYMLKISVLTMQIVF